MQRTLSSSFASAMLASVVIALTGTACPADPVTPTDGGNPTADAGTDSDDGCSIVCGEGTRCCPKDALGLSEDICVPEGQACPLPCAGGGACTIGTLCVDDGPHNDEENADANATCIPTASCDAINRCGTNNCCAAGTMCSDNGRCVAPDLSLSLDATAMRIETRDTNSTDDVVNDACVLPADAADSCLTGTGARRILTLPAVLQNHGPGDFVVGNSDLSSLLHDSSCGSPTRIDDFVAYRLRDAAGTIVLDSRADVGCVTDATNITSPDVPASLQYDSCAMQGLSRGMQTSNNALACGYIDITDVADGTYTLELEVNPVGIVSESDTTNNIVTVPVEIAAEICGGVMCGGICCDDAAACVDGACLLPDLTIDLTVLQNSAIADQANFGAESCAIQEGCVDAPGDRRILRFSTTTPNIGPVDLYMGPPEANPIFEYSSCHNHYHFQQYADYKLYDLNGNVVANGHKQAFCLIDLTRIDPNAGPPKYNCSNQGISAGWGDTYHSGLDCQWIDITDVPPGDYELEVAVNPSRIIKELDYTNNLARVRVNVPADPFACNPVTEICQDGIDQNCDNNPDDNCPAIDDSNTCQNARQIEGSGLFTATLGAAGADLAAPSCFPQAQGGVAMFSFTVPYDETVYLSTYGSGFDTVLSIYKDNCGAAEAEFNCSDDGCGTEQSDFFGKLTPGFYWAAVRAKSPEAAGEVKFKIQRSGCDSPLIPGPGNYSGNTQGEENDTAPTCAGNDGGGVGPDDLIAFKTCPGATSFEASTCGNTRFDSLLELREGACLGRPVVDTCNDDDQNCGNNQRASSVSTVLQGQGAGDGMWFILVDGYRAQSQGTYSLGVQMTTLDIQ